PIFVKRHQIMACINVCTVQAPMIDNSSSFDVTAYIKRRKISCSHGIMRREIRHVFIVYRPQRSPATPWIYAGRPRSQPFGSSYRTPAAGSRLSPTYLRKKWANRDAGDVGRIFAADRGVAGSVAAYGQHDYGALHCGTALRGYRFGRDDRVLWVRLYLGTHRRA